MGFIKEFRDFDEEMPEWKYLNSIGARTMLGHELRRHAFSIVKDEEKKYFLVPQGHTGISHTEEDLFYYLLCLDGKKIQIETLEDFHKNADKTVDMFYAIEKIEIIDKDVLEKFNKEELLELIKEALTARAEVEADEHSKNGTVRFTGLDESKLV